MRLFIIILIIIIFLATLLNKRTGVMTYLDCDSPQASMKLSPPPRSPALPRRGPHHHTCLRRCCCSSSPRRRCSPVRVAGTAGMAGTADSPAQGG